MPVITGSLIDLTVLLSRETTVNEINQSFIKASSSYLNGVLSTTNEPIVSSDIIKNPKSSIVDLSLTQVVDGNLIRVVAWYDNEWGFTNRLVELLSEILKHN